MTTSPCWCQDAGGVHSRREHLLRVRVRLGLEAVHVRDGVRLRLGVGVRLGLQAVRLHSRRLRLLGLHVPQQPGLACSGLQCAPRSTTTISTAACKAGAAVSCGMLMTC